MTLICEIASTVWYIAMYGIETVWKSVPASTVLLRRGAKAVISRRAMQAIVGSLWLFTAAFVSGGTVIVDVCLAAVQILLGLALLFNLKLKSALSVSILWSIFMWIVHGNYGQIMSGQVLPLYGATGTAILFGITSAAIWPARKGGPSLWNERGVRFAQITLGVLFAVGFLLHFQVTYLMNQGVSPFADLPWFQSIASYQGSGLSMILAVSELVIALMFIGGFSLRWAMWLSVVIDILFWTLQSFGEILDPLAVSTPAGLLLLAAVVSAGPKQWRHRTQSTDTCRPVLH